ncbi:hypothetical protein BC829DRAFT_225580 [Chytridium lagenaria]|nr:hypothetical protein BC829DRAFT_225580 [Chytridium lagenaria]
MIESYGARFREEDSLIDIDAPYTKLDPNEDFADETLFFDLKAYPSLVNIDTANETEYLEAYNLIIEPILSYVFDAILLENRQADIIPRRRRRSEVQTPGQQATSGVLPMLREPSGALSSQNVENAIDTNIRPASVPMPTTFWDGVQQFIIRPNALSASVIVELSTETLDANTLTKASLIQSIGRITVIKSSKDVAAFGNTMASSISQRVENLLLSLPTVDKLVKEVASLNRLGTETKVQEFFSSLGYIIGEKPSTVVSSYKQIFKNLAVSGGGGATHPTFGTSDIEKAWDQNKGFSFPKFLGIAIAREFEKDPVNAMNTLPAFVDGLFYDFESKELLAINDNAFMESLDRSLTESVKNKEENKQNAIKFLNMFTVESQVVRFVKNFQSKVGLEGKALQSVKDVVDYMTSDQNVDAPDRIAIFVRGASLLSRGILYSGNENYKEITPEAMVDAQLDSTFKLVSGVVGTFGLGLAETVQAGLAMMNLELVKIPSKITSQDLLTEDTVEGRPPYYSPKGLFVKCNPKCSPEQVKFPQSIISLSGIWKAPLFILSLILIVMVTRV